MPNPKRGEMEIEIGGERRPFRLDFNALCELEAIYDRPVQKIFEEGTLGLRVVRDSLYVGLASKDRKVTAEQVGRWMQDEPDRLSEWGAAVAQAASASLGVKPDAKASEDTEKASPLGSGSTTTS